MQGTNHRQAHKQMMVTQNGHKKSTQPQRIVDHVRSGEEAAGNIRIVQVRGNVRCRHVRLIINLGDSAGAIA